MTVRVFVSGERIGPQLQSRAKQISVRMRAAERGAASDVRDEALERGRANISGAGRFGTRWTEGFQGKITEGGGFVRINFTHGVKYWKVFQYGATIHGRPLLWIPLSFAADAQGKSARDYPGRLFRVDRKRGAPLLLSVADKQPKYFGKASVRIPKKFKLIEIIRDSARHLKDFYRSRMKNNG